MDAVRLDGIEIRIDRSTIVGPVSFTVACGERWALLGPNGSGKTTLLSVAGGWRHPSTGVAWVLGERLGRTDVRALRARIGHIGQQVDASIRGQMRVIDVVLTGRRSTLATWLQDFDADDIRRSEARLAQVGCADLRDRPLATCSQGERQRVLLARALVGDPELLLFDEPAAGLDLPGRETLLSSMSTIGDGQYGPATITATHHLEELPCSTTHAALLRAGTLLAAGPVAQTLTDELLTRTFGIAVHVALVDGRWSARAARQHRDAQPLDTGPRR